MKTIPRIQQKMRFALFLLIIIFAGRSQPLWADELSKEERAFLDSRNEIVFISQTWYPPFEFVDENDEHTGMCIELARWIATELGFKTRFMATHFQQAQQDVLSGKADVLTSFFYSEKRDELFEFTQPIFEVPASIFIPAQRTDIKDIHDLKNKQIAMQKGDYAKEFLDAHQIPFFPVFTKDFSQATDLVITNTADALIGDEQIVLYHVFKNRLIDKIKKAGQPLYIGQNCMATAESNRILAQILSKGVRAAQTKGVLGKINEKWIGTHYSIQEPFLSRYKIHLSAGAGIIFALILLIWLWNVRLRSAVRQKTEEIRKREQALFLSEHKLKAILEASPDPMVFYDSRGYPQYLSPEFVRIFGWTLEELKDKHIPYVPEELQPQAEQKIKELYRLGKPLSFETKRYTKDKKLLDVILSASVTRSDTNEPNGLVVNLTDISTRKILEAQYEQAQKMESLGTLAGGIAHDFNNLLSGIYGYLDLAMKSSNDSKVSRYIMKAFESSDRAKSLTQQLLTFSKGGAPVKSIESLIPFIQETTQFALSGASTSCRFDLSEDLWMCDYDKNQMAQVIDNIVINASHAMPSGGIVAVSAMNIQLADDAHPVLKPGKYVKISISDTGIGIPEKYQPRIFDPFFTTKQKGSGLGLTTSYSIVKRHDGIIEVDSEQGKGSVFHIFLPATGDTGSKNISRKETTYQGKGKILIMDDEEVIREMLTDMLVLMGFSCASVGDGEAAIAAFEQAIMANDPFDGIILDLTVPGGLGGKETVERIRQIDRKIPVFVASGYSDDTAIAHPEQFGFTASLEKPFMVSELIHILKKYL